MEHCSSLSIAIPCTIPPAKNPAGMAIRPIITPTSIPYLEKNTQKGCYLALPFCVFDWI